MPYKSELMEVFLITRKKSFICKVLLHHCSQRLFLKIKNVLSMLNLVAKMEGRSEIVMCVKTKR